ncbi:MAG: S8 family serine peptidase [Gemmatimonadales bacterium]|nr:MAG: S8 family serine peptidase [Gemmatimonadales bacterium]
MRRTLPLALAAVFAVSACQDTSSPAGPEVDPPIAEAAAAGSQAVDVIVTLEQDFAPGGHQANQQAAAAVARSLGLSPAHAYGTALYGFSATVPSGRLNALARDPRVAAVELDQVATIIPRPGVGPARPPWERDGGGGGEETGGQSTPWGITRVNGGVSGATGTAWIIDSGIDLDHPDLNVDVNRSVDFTGSRKGADDENGHGTHVAGTVAAIDNDIGVIGVAAGASVVAVRVLDRRGSGSYSGVIAGVDHVAANGSSGDVANMSLGGGFSQALNEAVVAASAQVKFVLAAGNESTNAGTRSPASANGNNIYTVSAFAEGDAWASFSNFGNPPVDYAAPGVGVESTYKGGGYATLNGTSMAAPHVAGILLLRNLGTDGTVNGDPDGSPDPIAVHSVH